MKVQEKNAFGGMLNHLNKSQDYTKCYGLSIKIIGLKQWNEIPTENESKLD